MNTTVFVLMVLIHLKPTPTIEFYSMDKCQSAIKTINNSPEVASWDMGKLYKPFCLRIEK